MLLDLIQDKKTLQISYWGEGGKTFIDTIEIKDEDFFEYVTSPKNKNGEHKDELCKDVKNWNGQRVYKHKLDPRKDRLNRYRLYEIVDALPEEQKEKIFAYNIPELFYIDIENKLQDGKPNPENPDKPITVIGICCPNDTIMVLSGGYNLTQKQQTDIQKRIDEHFSQIKRHFKFVFRYFETEYDMLYFFLNLLVPKMACMTGWNFEDYDWRYIYNRAKLLKIDPTISSPCRRMTGQTERPAHVGLIDYLKAYKKWTWNTNENYRLDTIGEKLIGIKKVQHAENLDDMLNNDFEKYVYYNAIDCCLVKLIHEACNAVTCGLTTAWLGHIRAMDCFSTTYIPENLLRESFREQGKVLGVDPDKKKGEKGEKYEGAFVKQPVPGLHKHCMINDYSSLYPTLQRQFNIGPETLVTMLPEKDEELKQQWRDKGYIVCASGAVFQKEDGNLKKIITDLYTKRKTYKKTSFKYQQNYYDIKEMVDNNVGMDEINDYLKKNEIHNVVNEDGEGRLKAIMNYCLMMSDIYNNYQLGTKVVINGIYGAFGFSGFYFYNRNIAEAVTKQGKNVILNAESLINKWAQKVWLKDKKTHKMMGVAIKPSCKSITNSVSIYCDTDSIYSSYTEIIESTDWLDHQVWRLTKVNKQNDQKEYTYVSKGGYPTLDDAKEYFNVSDIDLKKYSYDIDEIDPDGREFCLTLNRVFMADFLKKIHDEYAEKQGTPNILDFELEGYLDAGIWLAKKKYIKNLTWAEPNIYYDSCTKIKPTGVEIAQTSSSPWVKKQLTDMVKWIFKQENFTMEGMVAELSKVKKQFMLQSPEVICVNKGMNKYSEYVMNDTDEIELQPKAMVTIQGASFYNHLLNTNEKYKKKYGILSDSDKLCVLYIKPTHKFTYWKKETNIPIKEYVKCPDMYKLVSDKKATIRPDGMGKPYEAFTDVMSKTQVEALSFPAGLYPKDMVISKGIEIDYERMFDLLILGPMNRIIEAMGNQPVSLNMTFEGSLW